jgi:hypothetical protein
VLTTLMREGTLTCDSEQRFRLNDARISSGTRVGPPAYPAKAS